MQLQDTVSVVIGRNNPALDWLHAQLQMIQLLADAREARLTEITGEGLLRQQRFLEAKAG